MGTLRYNEEKKQEDQEALETYFNKYFKKFSILLTEKVANWSSSLKVEEICKNINLYMILSFESGDHYWVDASGAVQPLEEDKGQKEKLGGPMEQRKVCNVRNTRTGFSEYFRDLPKIEWIITYNESKNVYKFVTCVILNMLEYSIKDLYILKNSEEEFKKYIEDFDFMDIYIKEMRKCYMEVPDTKLITAILQEPYERRESCGTIHFVNNLENIETEGIKLVRFDKKNLFKVYVSFKDLSSIRKLLEICSDKKNSLVVSTCEQEWVVSGVVSNKLTLKAEKVFSIVFYKNQWDLRYREEALLRYQNGSYHIDFEDKENRIEQDCTEADIEYEKFSKLFKILEEEAVHGALVIIAEDAKTEVERLCKEYGRGVAIEEFTIEEDSDKACQLILGFTYVDGAVFLDYNGVCYGFSIILDGKAKVRGEKSRGSRYNSAVNYITNAENNIKRCAVVRSEDQEKGLTIISNKQAWEKYSK